MAFSKYFSEDDIAKYSISSTDEVESVLTTDLSGIFGMPYQFLESTDQRIPNTEIGQKYAEKIVSKLPLLFITPCKQVFMPYYDESSKEKVLDALINGDTDVLSSVTATNAAGKYYTTEFAYSEYYRYVNTMCSELATFLGIASEEINFNGSKTKILNIDWSNAHNTSFDHYFSASKAVVFYVDGLTSMSESFSNSTTESSLASTINGYSDSARELQFLVGKDSAASALYSTAQDAINSASSALSGSTSAIAGGMLGDLAKTGVSTVLTGGKIIFPKIWQDSSFSRSYSFDIKLRSPDHDSMSIFFNELVPYIHILAATLPVGISDDPNGYTSPFLVKGYCKGMFNIDMGLITDLSVTRGAECQWNDDGLPTQMDISITIDDLYSSLFMTDDSEPYVAVVKNTAMLDFLSNMAGLNIAATEVFRRTKMLAYLTEANVSRIPSNIWSSFETGVANTIAKIYNTL